MRRILFFVIAMMLAALGACAKDAAQTADSSGETSEETIQSTTLPEQTPAPTKEPIPDDVLHTNILLLGASSKDFTRDNGSTPALTHILITLDPAKRSIKATTFPYNLGVTTTTDNGTETVQLQFVCTNVGEDGVVKVLEDNFGINIDYWVLMNMRGVSDTIDALGGIDIDVKDLSINDMGEHVSDILGLAWQKVTQTGMQTLTGVQTSGYFNNTWDAKSMEAEELLFRERHSNIIRAVAAAAALLDLNGDDMVAVATGAEGNYNTSIPDDEWQSIADTAIFCLENDVKFLHVPQVIKTMKLDNGWNALEYTSDDVTAVQDFVGN